MSQLTTELVPASKIGKRRRYWQSVFGIVGDRLEKEYGVPTLGNFRDPVREIFFIALSARTTDAQYRNTHNRLFSRFRTIAELANGSLTEIRRCILGGGLWKKRASQVRRIAKTLAGLGSRPDGQLRRMDPLEVFHFLSGLAGLGPKSALCVMMYSLNHDVFPVDINVQRIAERLGAIRSGVKHWEAQQRLPAMVPEGRSRVLHIGLVVHGRTVCLPRTPRCESCVLLDVCRFGMRRTGVTNGVARS